LIRLAELAGLTPSETQIDILRERDDINPLWRIAARTDSRIEPISVGERQYQEDDSRAIIEIVRREGQIVTLAE